MALNKEQVLKAVTIVAADPEASSRIQSALSFLGRNSGFTRNMMMAMGFGVAKTAHDAILEAGRRGGVPPMAIARAKASRQIPFDPNRSGSMGYELQCTEIAVRAAAAIEAKKSQIPNLAEASQCSRSVGFAHAGVLLVMKDGTKGASRYVLDWWATLDVQNPLVFRYDDFDQNRFMSGTAFENFISYS